MYYANDSAPKRGRPEGHKAVVELIEHSNLNQNDFIILTYYDKNYFKLQDGVNASAPIDYTIPDKSISDTFP